MIVKLNFNKIKAKLDLLNIAKIFAYLWLIFLFFPIRYVFPSAFSYAIGIYSDFTSFSLYLSDVFIFLAFICIILSSAKDFYHVVTYQNPTKWLVLWLFLSFFITFNKNWQFSLFCLVQTLELIVSYGTIAVLSLKQNKMEEVSPLPTVFSLTFLSLATFQSLLALCQFYLQHPVGLFKLGEQQIFPYLQGVAKVVSYGTTYVRGYGTFPHPNILSVFILSAIFLNIFLFLHSRKVKHKILLVIFQILNILGLFITFSRAAILALVSGIVMFYGFSFFYYKYREKNIKLFKLIVFSFFPIILGIILSISIFSKFLLTRVTISDQATVERGAYNHIGIKIIKSYPIFGIGIGQSMFVMEQFSDVKLWPWQIQPIHNYYLLSAAELGIPGALLLVWIFWYHLEIMYHQLCANFSPYLLSLLAILMCFVILMLFDHYFYTLKQTQFLLWIVLGLIAAVQSAKLK